MAAGIARFIAISFVGLLFAGLPACGGDDTTTPVDNGTPDVTEVAQDLAADPQAGEEVTVTTCDLTKAVPGLAYRLTKLDVKQPSQPEALKDFLNAIWAPDVCDQRLNIILRLDKVDTNTDGTLGVTFTAGSGWPCDNGVNKAPADMITVRDCGDAAIPQYTDFCFVEGGTTTFLATVDKNCHFQTTGAANLNFHPGPKDHALICSGGDAALGLLRDTIPLANLVAYGDFNGDFSGVTNGNLKGCIEQTAAGQICSFMTAPDYKTWSMTPDPSASGEPFTAYYCQKNCSASGWVNFGGFTQDAGVPLECKVNAAAAGNDAYQLSGDFSAGKINVQ